MSSDPFRGYVFHLGQEKLSEVFEIESGSSDRVQAILLIDDVLFVQRVEPWLHKRVIFQSYCRVSAALLIYVHFILSHQGVQSIVSLISKFCYIHL